MVESTTGENISAESRWWAGWDSNPQSKDYESSALTVKLPAPDLNSAASVQTSRRFLNCKPSPLPFRMTIIRLFGAHCALRSEREAVFRVGLNVILPRALGADAVVVELDPAGELNEADDPVIVRIRRVIASERNDGTRRACQILGEAIFRGRRGHGIGTGAGGVLARSVKLD